MTNVTNKIQTQNIIKWIFNMMIALELLNNMIYFFNSFNK